MPDSKLLDAYQMAAQMDEQQEASTREDERKHIEQFLNTIGMIESSGGKNFAHDEIKHGIHRGHRAAGTYGLMPNTVNEILNRMRMSGTLDPEMAKLGRMEPGVMKQYIEQNPEVEQELAASLAKKVLDKQRGDEEKAAYSWFQGHNLTPEEIEKRGYKEHDYVAKYRKYRGE